MPMLANRTG